VFRWSEMSPKQKQPGGLSVCFKILKGDLIQMKKLLVVVALAALMTPVFAAENVSMGGSVEVRGAWVAPDNANDSKYTESEIYLWATADLADNVMTKVTLKYKNDFGTGNGSDVATSGDIDLWEGYVKLAKMYDSPVSVVVGRWMNEVKANGALVAAPKYGEGFIIPNNVPVDGVMATLDFDPTYVDFFAWKEAENARNLNDDITLYGIYGSTKAFECWTADAYLLYGDDQGQSETIITPDGPLTVAGNYQHVWVAGVRAEGSPVCVEGLNVKAELAYANFDQENSDNDPDGFGGYVGASYTFASDYKPSVRANFYYLDDEFAQPLGHVDQDDLGESAYGIIADNNSLLDSNIWFINVGASVKPTDKINVAADFFYYQQPQESVVGLGSYDKLGMEIDLNASYQYSENVACFVSGAYFSPDDEELALVRNTPADDTWLLKGGVKVVF